MQTSTFNFHIQLIHKSNRIQALNSSQQNQHPFSEHVNETVNVNFDFDCHGWVLHNTEFTAVLCLSCLLDDSLFSYSVCRVLSLHLKLVMAASTSFRLSFSLSSFLP